MRWTCVRGAPWIGMALRVATLTGGVVAADNATEALNAGIRQAAFTLVGTVTETRASRRRSSFGDEVIVTTAIIQVTERLRGLAPSWLPVEVEGGSVGDVTMEVSDTPMLRRGDRAVFMIDRLKDGRYTLHDRGRGIAPLMADDHIKDSALTLDAVRRMAAEIK
jgi:hypothetical protein